jgi:NADH-quinone oxidoreductase subunit N
LQAFNFPLPETQWDAIMPIAIVTITGILALIFEMMRPKHKNDMVVAVSLLGLLVAGLVTFMQIGTPRFESFADMYLRDNFGGSMQLLLILSAFLCVLFSEPYLRQKRIAFGEFYPLVLWSTVGGMLMSATNNLLMLFLGLEILSVSLYVMAGMSRQEEKSEESAMKYFLLGAFASGFLLFGIAFVYGGTGSLHLTDVVRTWLRGDPQMQTLILFGFALILVGLCFKSGLVPFHQWTPDVYEGAPTNVTAFMSTVSKVGALAALVRILEAGAWHQIADRIVPALSVVAVLTMLLGNLVALRQRDVKRILAYSSIAHAGYALVAILAHASAPESVGTATITFYLLTYVLASIGAFAVLSLLARDGAEPTSIDDLRGLYRRSPLSAGVLVLCMLSLIGIPPTAGFVGKLMIFNEAMRANLVVLAIVLAISSAISIYYYLVIALAACTDAPDERALAKPARPILVTGALCAAGIIAVTLGASYLSTMFGTGYHSDFEQAGASGGPITGAPAPIAP